MRSFETGEQPRNPRYTDRFVDAVDEITDYNRSINATYLGFDLNGVDEDSTLNAQLEKIKKDHASVLNGMGIGLSEATDRLKEREAHELHELHLRLKIDDEDKFISTLQRFTLDESDRYGAGESVSGLIETYINSLRDNIKSEEVSDGVSNSNQDVVERQCGYLPAITEAFISAFQKPETELNELYKDAINRARDYITFYQKGMIHDYIKAEEAGLISYGYDYPHTYLNVEAFDNYWQTAFNFMNDLKDSPLSVPFYNHLRARLLHEFKDAIDTIADLRFVLYSPHINDSEVHRKEAAKVFEMRTSILNFAKDWELEFDTSFDCTSLRINLVQNEYWPELTASETASLLPESSKIFLTQFDDDIGDEVYKQLMIFRPASERLMLIGLGMATIDDDGLTEFTQFAKEVRAFLLKA